MISKFSALIGVKQPDAIRIIVGVYCAPFFHCASPKLATYVMYEDSDEPEFSGCYCDQ